MTRRVLLLASLAAALAAGGCGDSGSGSDGNANQVLAATAENLGEIRSGDLRLELLIGSDDAEAGFRLEGPFAFAETEGALPVAELAYTQISGDEESTTTLIATGDRAWVEREGEVTELPEEALADLRGAGASGSGGGGAGLGELRIDDWFVDPEASDGGDVGGAETDRIEADLDVPAAAADLLELLQSLGAAEGTTLDESNREQLARAVDAATVEVVTGKDDRLLRRLVADATFAAEPPPELEDLYANLPGATFHLELAIDEPNGEISVEPPEGS